jgi:hypothetical protein
MAGLGASAPMFLKNFYNREAFEKFYKNSWRLRGREFQTPPRQPQVKGVIDLLQTTSCRK